MRTYPILVLLLLLLATCVASSPDDGQENAISYDREASMNFDLEDLVPFLLRVSQKLDGFSTADAERIGKAVASMEVGTEREWPFEVMEAGAEVPLRVRVLLDDNDAPDAFFFSSAGVAQLINGEMRAFAEEWGI